MKNILKGLSLALIFITGINIGAVLGKINTPKIEEVHNEIEVVDTYHQEGTTQKYDGFYLEDGDYLTVLSDGSWAISNEKTNLYIFQPIDLGDWDYQVDNAEQLKNIVDTYISMKNTGEF